MMYRLFAAVNFALLLSVGTVRGQPVDVLDYSTLPNLYGAFTRVFYEGAEPDTIAGEIYFQAPNHVYLRVHRPVDQIFLIDNEEFVTKIYYPKTKRGFLLTGKAPADLPIIPGLAAAIQPDYGLESLGFEIYDQTLSGDSLISYWSRLDGGDGSGTFRLVQVNDALHYVRFEAPTVQMTVHTKLEDHANLEGFHIPSQIATEEHSAALSTREVINLSNLEADPSVPHDLRHFQFPEDADVTEKSW